ncbi:MAG TPA: TonB family protein, partial [Polyangiaceae bacterium]|nr:TonB family protein [Polyangiaceae bacterium]
MSSKLNALSVRSALLRGHGYLHRRLCLVSLGFLLSVSPVLAQAEPASTAAVVEEEEGETPSVIAPQLQHYEPPVYPDAAFKAGLESEVQVLITVGEDGKVSNPEVVDKQGHGFDEAAMAAALKLVFSPALVDGLPKSVRIGFQFSFTIDEVEKTVQDEKAAKAGELAGKLLISATETALPGATVLVVDALGNEYSTTTDADGSWQITALTPGTYTVRIQSEGFSPVVSEEQVEGGSVTDVTYRLLPMATEDEVVIVGERPPREMTKRTIERREMQRVPGTNGDALRAIQNLPGVARPPGLAGLLIVRGSAPNATGTFVDGANVPLIYHFGGLSSVVPTELLDKIDFYPGNFSAYYGRATGGVLDARSKRPLPDQIHGSLDVSLLDTSVYLEVP